MNDITVIYETHDSPRNVGNISIYDEEVCRLLGEGARFELSATEIIRSWDGKLSCPVSLSITPIPSEEAT